MKLTEKHTKIACYIAYIDQAIVNNLPPLLFVTFQKQFGISLELLGLLVFLNFFVQIFVDLLGAGFVDRIGYRPCVIAAHITSALGLILMGVLPPLLGKDAFAGVLIAMFLNAIGGGLLEVLVSPIIESLPGDAKAADMSLLHSFYCWGHVGVVLLSTLYFVTAGTAHWQWLPLLWAAIPLCNLLLFARVPLRVLVEPEQRVPVRKILGTKMFWLFLLMMIASGASEQAMVQWSSLFAETGLGVSKTVGDLLGPCAFAVLMGMTRVFYGKKGEQLDLRKALVRSSVLCLFSYLLCVFAPFPLLSLAGCALCGLSVGLMWPGVYSLGAKYFPAGGTAMFALLALAGDVGCSTGPGLVGLLSGVVQRYSLDALAGLFPGGGEISGGLKFGLSVAAIFPIILFASLLLLKKARRAPGEK